MKKNILILILLFLVCGCNNSKNSLVESNYINNSDYHKIYSDLTAVCNEIRFIPGKENERKFYEMIEVISDNCNHFSNDELSNLYNLINNNYQFIYSGNRYTNDDYQSDLNSIKGCLTE